MPEPEGQTGAPPEPPATPPPASTDLPPEVIRNSPEYQTLARQNRELARNAGRAEAEAARVRAAAESDRLAAEARQQTIMAQQLSEILGDQGVAAWAELSELSSTDPLAAARKLKELMGSAQSGSPTPPVPGTPPPPGAPVPPSSPPAPPAGVGAGAPLGQPNTGPGQEESIAALEQHVADVAKRAQDPMTRGRVTMRERSDAMMDFIQSAYLKAGVKPRS